MVGVALQAATRRANGGSEFEPAASTKIHHTSQNCQFLLIFFK
jgi:hypothetical protein